MLLEINKQLLRNDLKLRSKLHSIKQLQNADFIDWFYQVMQVPSQQQDHENYSIFAEEKKQKRKFLIKNFDHLVKKKQFIQLLFYVWVQYKPNQLIQNSISKNNKQQKPKSQKFTQNFAQQAKNLLIDIARFNPRLNKDLYHIIDSNSQLGQVHMIPSYYTDFYAIIVQIDRPPSQQGQNINQNENPKYWQFVFQQLTFWWSNNKDYLITSKFCYLRYNLLAFFLQKSDKQKIIGLKDGVFVARISSGIQKRLIQTKYHKAAILIWTKLAKLLELDTQINIEQKAQYFKLSQQSLPVIIVQNQTTHDIVNLQNKAAQDVSKNLQNNKNFNVNQPQQQNSSKIEPTSDNQDQFLDQEEFQEVKIKAPQTLQDSILSLQNPLRRDIGLKRLKILVKKQQQDLIFVWKNLLRSLLYPLTEQSGQILKDLLLIRPKQWIEDVSEMFFKKDSGMNDKIILIENIEKAVNELSQNPNNKIQQTQDQGDFYFKRVTSKYFVQKPVLKQKSQPQSRRWGHTRIAYQQSMNKNNKTVNSLLIVGNNDPYLNRLYPIITQLFFKIIIKLVPQSKKSCLSNPSLSQRILNLLGTIAQNLKNYYEKYLILEQILIIVDKILAYIQSESQKQKKTKPIMNFEMSWDAKSVSTIVISCIQVLNKVSLSLDKYLPELMLLNLKECVQKLKKMDIYGIRPLVEMLEANIFNKIN